MTTPPPEATPRESVPLEPGTHFRLSVLLYVAVSLLFGLPTALWPGLIWGTLAGASDSVLAVMDGMRWAGAILIAWAAGGLLVLARPKGRQTMVTTFALQFSLATVALVFSALTDEFTWAETWFVVFSIVAVGGSGLYLWYGRWVGREILNA
jgi:hypothetical protein